MIVALVLLGLVGMAMPQRSPYLGNSGVYPDLLPRFRPNASTSSSGSSNGSTSGGLGDRLGTGERPAAPSFGVPADGTLYDKETVDRVSQWPKDKQPFWYVNRQQIAGQKGSSNVNGTK